MKLNWNGNVQLFDKEKQKKYKDHFQRIQSILKKKKGFNALQSRVHKKISLNGYQILKKRNIEEQNQRLMKKLSQICKRKNTFTQQNEQQKYCTLNMKYRQIIRRKKVEEIQLENDNIVDRIVDKFSRRPSIIDRKDIDIKRSKSQKKKIHKYQRNRSVMLPEIEVSLTSNKVHTINLH